MPAIIKAVRTLVYAKVSADADKRTVAGQVEWRMACSSCGLVRWFPKDKIWTRHDGCRGVFMFTREELKRAKE